MDGVGLYEKPIVNVYKRQQTFTIGYLRNSIFIDNQLIDNKKVR
jgi:hypothetical protein